jgi:hypothetical protein
MWLQLKTDKITQELKLCPNNLTRTNWTKIPNHASLTVSLQALEVAPTTLRRRFVNHETVLCCVTREYYINSMYYVDLQRTVHLNTWPEKEKSVFSSLYVHSCRCQIISVNLISQDGAHDLQQVRYYWKIRFQ